MPTEIPTRSQLRSHQIFSSYDLCSRGAGKVFISFRGPAKAASKRGSAWQVHGIGFRTDPNAEFLDYGAKTFEVEKGDQKMMVLSLAQAWAAEQYGITDWIRDPFGGWQDAAALKRAIQRMDFGGTGD